MTSSLRATLAAVTCLSLLACSPEQPAGPGSATAPGQTGATVTAATGPGETAPLLLMRPAAPVAERNVLPFRRIPLAGASRNPAAVSAENAAPTSGPAAPIPVSTPFTGLGSTLSGFVITGAPPDPTGAVGPNHYVQAVNGGMAVFSKTGTVISGPTEIRTLFASLGGHCAAYERGDPYVLYDQLADRWLVSQFAFGVDVSGNVIAPYTQCIAVSKTGDPTGAWWTYAFTYAAFNDYPKFALWPDAYYATYVMFAGGATYAGSQVCALDRAAMLAGQAATQQCFSTGTTYGTLLVSSLVGPTPPPAGSPAYVLSQGPADGALTFWKFHVDWTTPASSTLSTPVTLTTAAYTLPCPTGATPFQCATQPGTTQTLDTLGDRLMTPLGYRNLGDHESLVANHTVAAGGTSGVRWYEIRSPATTPVIFQQGTVAPDAAYRFMGSVAMDAAGNIAVGYTSTSAALSVKPSIAISGRLAGDPLGTMPQGETILKAGAGVQTTNLERWGDYTSMTVDPTDDCTFYYTNQYQPSNGTFNWATAVGRFTFPSCVPDFGISASPASLTVTQGTSQTSTVSTTRVGSPGTVSLQATVSPAGAGVTASLNPTSVAAGSPSTLTVSATAGAPAGAYTVTVTGTEGTATHFTTVNVTVIPPADFTISAAPASRTVTQGASGTSTISTTQVGSPGTVALQAVVSPAGTGVTASLSAASVAAGGSSTLTVDAAAGATPGAYTVTVTGTEGSFVHATPVAITVVLPADFGIAASPTSLTVSQGSTAPSTISTTQVGSAGTVALQATVSPAGAGVTAAVNPGSVAAGTSSTLTVTAAAGATTGAYTVTVTGTEGSFVHAASVSVTVVLPSDFGISASPTSRTVAQGSSGTSTISTTQVGGPGTVTLQAAVAPSGAGVTASLSPTSVATGASSTLTVAATSSATPGSYTVTVTGVDGAFTHATSVAVTVPAPTPAPTPDPGGKSGCSTSGPATASLLPLLVFLLPRRRRR